MQDSDRGFKEVARLAGRELARIAGVPCDRWRPLVSEVQTTERFADRAFLARRGVERFVVYFEAYSRWSPHAPWNTMTKAALLSERELLPTVAILFILQRRGYRPQGGCLRLEVGGELTQELRFHEVPMWELEPQSWWEDVPALMPLYPLCRHGRTARDAVLYADAVISERIAVGPEQATAPFLLSVFGNMADRRLDAESLIGREHMMQSRLVRDLLGEQGRSHVLKALSTRFDERTAQSFAQRLNDIDDLEQLDGLLQVAIRCSIPEEFARSLPQPPARPRRDSTRRRRPSSRG
jgi:hypothetical protein